jgi:DNA-binding NarL/FixJ family response regulator
MSRPSVLVAEDNAEMRQTISALIESHFHLVGTVTDGQQAIESAIRLNPDVVLLDIAMPVLNGIQVASRLRNSCCAAKLIIVTVHYGSEYIEAAYSLGVLGYVLKQYIWNDLIPAIEAALQGQRFTSKLETPDG